VQLAEWLSELVPPPPVASEEIEQLRAHLDLAAARAVEQLPADALPLRLPKSRLAELDRCERTALARTRTERRDEMTDAALRGIAVDRFVTHQLVAGRVTEPVEALRSMLAAEAEWTTLAHLEDLDPAHAATLVDALATTVADAWSGIGQEWAPRAQSRAMVVLADGAVVCSSVVDVELGGPSTDLPAVVVEVKSGKPVAAHQSEVYLYGLLVALRDGSAPAEVCRWYPGVAPAAVPVSLGLLESAAVRLEDGIRRWAELVAGREPTESPGPWCRWCPEADDCDSAAGPAENPAGPPVGSALGDELEGPEPVTDLVDDWTG